MDIGVSPEEHAGSDSATECALKVMPRVRTISPYIAFMAGLTLELSRAAKRLRLERIVRSTALTEQLYDMN